MGFPKAALHEHLLAHRDGLELAADKVQIHDLWGKLRNTHTAHTAALYQTLVTMACVDGAITPEERALCETFREHHPDAITPGVHAAALETLGWSTDEYAEGKQAKEEKKEKKEEKTKRKQYKEEVLPEARQAELTRRVNSWHAIAKQQPQPGSNMAPAAAPLHFEARLTAGERKFVHALCEARGSELSSKSEGAGAARHVVVYDAPVEEGVVGGVSAPRRAELAARVDAWMRAEMKTGAGKLHFEPTLTTAEREFVHQVAAQNGLSSKSEGKEYHGADWHIAVTARAKE